MPKSSQTHHYFVLGNVALNLSLGSLTPQYLVLLGIFGFFVAIEFPEHFAIVIYRLKKKEKPRWFPKLFLAITIQELIAKIIHYVVVLAWFAVHFQSFALSNKVTFLISFPFWVVAQLQGCWTFYKLYRTWTSIFKEQV